MVALSRRTLVATALSVCVIVGTIIAYINPSAPNLSSLAITDNACIKQENDMVKKLRQEVTDLSNLAYKIYHDGKKDTKETRAAQDALAKPLYDKIAKNNKMIDSINQNMNKKCTKIVSTGNNAVWKSGDYGVCKNGNRVRTVYCEGDDGIRTDASKCTTADKPLETESCISAGILQKPTLKDAIEATTPASRIFAGDAITDATKATYNFTSKDGSTTITELAFTVNNSIKSNPMYQVSGVKINNESKTIPSIGSGNPTFKITGLNIPVSVDDAGTDIVVDFSFNNPSAPKDKAPMSKISIILDSVTYGDTTAPIVMQTNLKTPTYSIINSGPSSAEFIPDTETVVAGKNKIGEIMISADQKGDIHISDIYAKIGFIRFSKNPKITQPTITATGNSNLSGTCRFRDDSKKSIRCSFDSALRIEAGTSQRFDIFVNQEKGIEESPAGSSDITMIAPMSFTWGDGISGINNFEGNIAITDSN